MAIDWRTVKKLNSKSELISHIKTLHIALEWYAREENWAVKEDDILWLGDDDPQYAALVTLGRRKPDPNYRNHWQKRREDGNQQGRPSKDNS